MVSGALGFVARGPREVRRGVDSVGAFVAAARCARVSGKVDLATCVECNEAGGVNDVYCRIRGGGVGGVSMCAPLPSSVLEAGQAG